MKQSEVIKHIILEQGIKQLTLANRLGMQQNNLSNHLSRGAIPVSTYVRMLNALNYKLVAVPDTVKLPKEAYEVTLE